MCVCVCSFSAFLTLVRIPFFEFCICFKSKTGPPCLCVCVCVWESVISELRRFVPWCPFFLPLLLIAERTFSLALCGWLKGQKRSAGLCSRRVISVCRSVGLSRRLNVLPIRHVIIILFPLFIAVMSFFS